MTVDEHRAKIREDTHTNTSDYSDASLIRDLNLEMIAVQIQINTARGPMEFDDPNNTGNPFEALAITAGTDTYDVQTDSNGDNINTIHKIVFQKTNIPRIPFTEGSQQGSLDTTDEAEVPSGYYDMGKNIKFVEIPLLSGSATIYYEREHHYVVVGDTSLVPGLPIAYHTLANKRVSRNYARGKTNGNSAGLDADVKEQEVLLGLYEESRRGDEGTAMTVSTVNGR